MNNIVVLLVFCVILVIAAILMYFYTWISNCLFLVNDRIDLIKNELHTMKNITNNNDDDTKELDKLNYWFYELEEIRQKLNNIEFLEYPKDTNDVYLDGEAAELVDEAIRKIEEASELLDRATNHIDDELTKRTE